VGARVLTYRILTQGRKREEKGKEEGRKGKREMKEE
jgi:hypothetical protein